MWSNICLSLFIILICNPYNIKNNGVLLSYGGTIGIICFLEIFNKKEKPKLSTENKVIAKIKTYIKGIFFVSLSAQIVIMPIIAYSYKTISFTFFVTNILTSFLIGIIIVFGFIIILISFISLKFASVFGIVYKFLIDILQIITEYTSKMPLSKIYIKTPHLVEIIIYYLIIFGIYYCIKKNISILKIIKEQHRRIVVILLLVVLICTLLYVEFPKDLKVYFIDVGQGDSCLIITPKNTKILIDGGGSESYDTGEKILLQYLLSRRITSIDYIIVSHFDTDHCRTD